MKRNILVIAFILFGPGIVEAQQHPYVDPMLRALRRPGAHEAVDRATRAERIQPQRVRPSEAEPRARLVRPRSGPLASLALERDPSSGQTRVGVLVQLREPVAASLAALRRAGAEVGTVVGDVATARVSIDALDNLWRLVEIRRVEAARRLSIVHDTSMAAIRAAGIRLRGGDRWYGSTGEGVIVGLYDTGIDYRHEDFRDTQGRSRILGLWDHATAGTPPEGFDYGHYCDNASLTDGTCPEVDIDGHGTHVAGTMAGNGSAAGTEQPYQYTGVAPLADLLVVKAGNFTEDEIIEGVDWIFRTAAALGRPAVVNLSLGVQWGPRDGTSIFERALDNLSGPGRIVVVAAGNDASNGNLVEGSVEPYLFHAMATPVVDSPIMFRIRVPSVPPNAGGCNDFGLIELWYDGADRLDIEVVRPGGESVSAASGASTLDINPEGTVWIENASGGTMPENGDHQAVIEISDCAGGGAPRPGTWIVRAIPRTVGSGGAPVHLWISATEYGADGAFRGISSNFDNGYIVSSPGTAREVITVGAYVTRTCWAAASGNWCWTARERAGDIAYFSSGGPTRDGRLKPEIAAPGRTIISTLSSQALGYPDDLVATDGVHAILQGTSMAAPHVAGAIALMLQHAPTLTPADVKSILQQTALQDGFTTRSYTGEASGTNPNNQWGYGKLDVTGAIAELASPSTIVVHAEATPPTSGSRASEAGTQLPLLRLRLRASDHEGTWVSRIGFTLTGHDPLAMLHLIHDVDGDGALDPGDVSIATQPVTLVPGRSTETALVPSGLVLSPGDSVSLLVVLELSGGVPNGTVFQARYEPSLLETGSLRSGLAAMIDSSSGAVASAPLTTSVLRPDEIFALSENPVVSDRVIFNFRERPRVAAVYTLNGARVADLLARMTSDGRVEWDLTNEKGSAVAAGVYLVVFNVGGELVTEKLIIVRRTEEEE